MEADTTTSPAELANVLKTQTARKAQKVVWRNHFKNITGNLIFGRIVILFHLLVENESAHNKTVYSESGETIMCPVRTHSTRPY